MAGPIAATVTVHADRPAGPYVPIWNWFGCDEPNYLYTRHGASLLAELSAISPASVRFRTHNLLTSGDGTPALKWGSTNAYSEDGSGNAVYDWTIMDRIFDTCVEAGIVPFVEIGFTPQALSAHPGPYRHHFSPGDRTATITAGWAAPPKDLPKWAGLIEAWAGHLGARYGRQRVAGWPFELWNEPDGLYWTGTIEGFCALYDVTAAALRRVLPEARIGGPHTCGPFRNDKAASFLRGFLRHCIDGRNAATGGTGSPLDFVAFHAKGNPSMHEGRVRMGLRKHLRDIEAGLAIVRELPELEGLPVILGESDPEGCAACPARYVPQNGYRNGPLYGAYVVEHIMRTYELSRRAGIAIEGAVTWAFLFEGQPLFEGFRDLATNGIGKPVLNAFRMLGMLGGEWIAAESSHALRLDAILQHGVQAAPDVNVAATRDESGVSVLLWHYHDDDTPGEAAEIALSIHGWPRSAATLRHYRMDADHSNAFALWQLIGSPAVVEGGDRGRLETAGKLEQLHPSMASDAAEGTIRLAVALPRQAVSLLRLE